MADRQERAYECTIYDDCSGERIIAFAESREKARSYASDEMGADYKDIQARRAKWADTLPRQIRVYGEGLYRQTKDPDLDSKVVMEAFRARGWLDEEFSARECVKCGLYEWEGLILSRLDDDGICGYCSQGVSPIQEED